ncbi:MAG: hypothetical protein OES23_04925 [Nitrosopumilus sp.]|nr:hypothetical protein [Nitrosopumilus sp.]
MVTKTKTTTKKTSTSKITEFKRRSDTAKKGAVTRKKKKAGPKHKDKQILREYSQ